jgi:hypothetical protein
LLADIQVRPAEDGRKGFKTAADVKDERERLVLLGVLQQEVREIAFSGACHSKNQRVRHLAVVQVQEVGRGIVRFKRGQVLGAKMRVGLLAGQDREQKREVRVVGIEQVESAQVLHIVAGDCGEIGIKLVVRLQEQVAVRIREYARKFPNMLVDLALLPTIGHNGQREIPQRLPIAEGAQAVAQVFDVGLL